MVQVRTPWLRLVVLQLCPGPLNIPVYSVPPRQDAPRALPAVAPAVAPAVGAAHVLVCSQATPTALRRVGRWQEWLRTPPKNLVPWCGATDWKQDSLRRRWPSG